MRRGRPSLAFAMLISGVLAGCAFPGGGVGKAFDAIPAPVWSAGYSWTYGVVASSQETSFEGGEFDGDSDTQTVRATFTVVNTSTVVLGEPVYVVKVDQSLDHPMFQGQWQAYTQRGLGLAAIGYDFEREIREEEPSSFDACRGTQPMVPVPPGERFPMLPFPLDDDATARGSWGFDEPFVFEYEIQVHGMVSVKVPAGEFEAVYVTTDLRPRPPVEFQQDPDFPIFNFRIRTEQWYSPDVRFFVKNVVAASAEASAGSEGSFRFAYRSAMELEDFSLQAGPEGDVPEVATPEPREPVAVPYRSYRVVSDQRFPVNVADGPVAARFGLEDAGPRPPDGPPRVVHGDAVPEGLDFDHEKHRVVWTVESWNGGGYERFEDSGDVLAFTFTRGGKFAMRAEIRPLECGGPYLGSAFGEVSTYWEKTFRIDGQLGPQRVVSVGEFPVEEGAFWGRATWTAQPTIAVVADRGHPVFRSPDGRSQAAPSGSPGEAGFNPYPAGLWKVDWDTEAVTLGDDFDLTVLVSYDNEVFA